jgi:glycosyltransferase involved in cell wall biosynthesis
VAACAARGVPIGLTFHSLANPEVAANPWRWRPGSLARVTRRCSWVSTCGASCADELAALLGSAGGRARVVANGCDPDRGPAPSRPRPFVLCAGRLAPLQGIDLLLLAWQDVRALASRRRAAPRGGRVRGEDAQGAGRRLGAGRERPIPRTIAARAAARADAGVLIPRDPVALRGVRAGGARGHVLREGRRFRRCRVSADLRPSPGQRLAGPRDADALRDAMLALLERPRMRAAMGKTRAGNRPALHLGRRGAPISRFTRAPAVPG